MARVLGRPHVSGLVWTLVRTDFKGRYHGTVAGFLWALLKPLTTFVVLLSVFSFLFKADPNYRIRLIIGLFLYEFFSDATKMGMASLASKAYLLTKARVPSWIIVLTSSSNAVITASIFFVVVLVFVTLSSRPPSLVGIALFVYYLLHYLLMIWGVSLGASVLQLRYRDLNQVWDVVTHAGFFLAPVVYPLDILPERVHFWLFLWPPTPIIQFSRAVLIDHTVPTLKAHLLLSFEAGVIFLVGVVIFRRYSARAMEYL